MGKSEGREGGNHDDGVAGGKNDDVGARNGGGAGLLELGLDGCDGVVAANGLVGGCVLLRTVPAYGVEKNRRVTTLHIKIRNRYKLH